MSFVVFCFGSFGVPPLVLLVAIKKRLCSLCDYFALHTSLGRTKEKNGWVAVRGDGDQRRDSGSQKVRSRPGGDGFFGWPRGLLGKEKSAAFICYSVELFFLVAGIERRIFRPCNVITFRPCFYYFWVISGKCRWTRIFWDGSVMA